MDIDYKKILKIVNKKNRIPRLIVLFLGTFIMALNYNLILLPNNIVVGGTSGLAIIFKQLFGWNDQVFIYAAMVVLLITSYIFLGKEKTSNTIIGSLLYPILVTLTLPLANYLLPYMKFESTLLLILISAAAYGLANGFIFKAGYTTGGSDVIVQIVNKYAKIPTGKSSFVVNVIIVAFGGIVFSINNVIYAVIIQYITGMLMDKILIGISDSKMFFIYTVEINKIKKFILNELKAGVTIFEIEGGYSKEKGEMLMCVVPTRDYYMFKETVLEIDPKAFFVISDCYEVTGGVKKSNLPLKFTE